MKIKIGFFSVMLFLSLLLAHSYFALASFLAVAVHELGHIIASKLCGIQLYECNIGIYGAGLTPRNMKYSYKDEIFLCACGPLINILSAIVFVPVYHVFPFPIILYFILSSLVLASLNLLPIKDFDGGRIFFSVLCLIAEPILAERIIMTVSFILILFLWLVSVYLLLVSGANLSLFIFSISLFTKIFVEH